MKTLAERVGRISARLRPRQQHEQHIHVKHNREHDERLEADSCGNYLDLQASIKRVTICNETCSLWLIYRSFTTSTHKWNDV